MNRKKIKDLMSKPLDELMSIADEVRRDSCEGAKIELCGIINAKSGSCPEDCSFCAQSARYNTGVNTYPLISDKEIAVKARELTLKGASRIGIVTSGNKLSTHEIESVSSAIRKFTKNGILPCASLGELDVGSFSCLKGSGLKRYHHNIETSENFFPRIAGTHTYRERVNTILRAKKAGMEICSGGIFGLGESWDDRIDMALALKALEVDSVPLNFLVPIAGTPLENTPLILVKEALTIVALFRIVLGKPVIRVAAGRQDVFGGLQEMIFSAGANGMMVGGYLTVPGADPDFDRTVVREALKKWARSVKKS